MSFLSKIKAKVAAAAADLGASVVKLGAKVGLNPSDALLTRAETRAEAFAAAVANAAEIYIDGLPGVPLVAAQLVSHSALTFVDGVIAGAIEGAKSANKD